MKIIAYTLFLIISEICLSQNTVPLFPKTPREVSVQISIPTTSRIALNNLVPLFTASSNGSKVVEIDVKADTTTVAGSLFIAITDTAGANPRLFDEILIYSISPLLGSGSFKNSALYNNLQIKAGQIIQVGATTIPVGGHLNVWISAGDY